MSVEVNGRHVVVTGGGKGIGAALAHEAAARGATHVSVVDIDADAAQAVVEELACSGSAHACDVSSAHAVETLAHEVVAANGTPFAAHSLGASRFAPSVATCR